MYSLSHGSVPSRRGRGDPRALLASLWPPFPPPRRAPPSPREDAAALDPDEPLVAVDRGPEAMPWHPARMDPPLAYRLCVLGAPRSGKSSLLARLTSHAFDGGYTPTRRSEQLFTTSGAARGAPQIFWELEDTAGVPAGRPAAALAALLRPLLWYERRREGGAEEARLDAMGLAAMAARGADPLASVLATARKRTGFVVVAAVDDAASFELAYALVDAIFDRLEYEPHHDAIACPAAVVLVGSKADRPPSQRHATAAALARGVEARYARRVSYVECSAATNENVAQVLHEALRRIKELPERKAIKEARRRGRGRAGLSFDTLVESATNYFRRPSDYNT
ncbi:hypothetical protein AB1Y20_011043 [Prymnesium parvum]|uniref:Cytoplasmic dynein 2 light intermediate chain 1 n=1 Tax=Prymnesium parvum TaxID=97485 RepID=A0AB34ILR1_PRYPA